MSMWAKLHLPQRLMYNPKPKTIKCKATALRRWGVMVLTGFSWWLRHDNRTSHRCNVTHTRNSSTISVMSSQTQRLIIMILSTGGRYVSIKLRTRNCDTHMNYRKTHPDTQFWHASHVTTLPYRVLQFLVSTCSQVLLLSIQNGGASYNQVLSQQLK